MSTDKACLTSLEGPHDGFTMKPLLPDGGFWVRTSVPLDVTYTIGEVRGPIIPCVQHIFL